MEIKGIQNIPAPRKAVWDALNDPAILKQCLPGCESVERISPEEFKVVVAAAIGPLRARFNGMLRMTEANAPASCVMVFEGQGGAIGFGKGSSSVELRETPEGTELSYVAKAEVGGKLAQVGSRLIDSVAKKMSDDFFKAFRRVLVPSEPLAEKTKAAVAASAALAPAARGTAPSGSIAGTDPAAPPEGPVHATIPVAAAPTPSPATPGAVMVPGWWLAVATILGSFTTVAGSVLVR